MLEIIIVIVGVVLCMGGLYWALDYIEPYLINLEYRLGVRAHELPPPPRK